ncbi:hypothetical protein [Microcoleus sp. CAWBG58]|uniref:hypothetical protein n=1 Tax=Microcoleus sp. CAWBG58 TaxID=2841651 RepID=UPI0025D96EE3|nr:hypothetical protein [Microcoleus sp. CAWBG58]
MTTINNDCQLSTVNCQLSTELLTADLNSIAILKITRSSNNHFIARLQPLFKMRYVVGL